LNGFDYAAPTSFSTYVVYGTPGDNVTYTLTVGATTQPSVSASIVSAINNLTSSPGAGVQDHASMSYDFAVTGPAGTDGTVVPVEFSSAGRVDAILAGQSALGEAEAQVTVSGPGVSYSGSTCVGSNGPCSGLGVNNTVLLSVTSGQIYNITMDAVAEGEATAYGLVDGAINITASVDPYVSIDPNFALASQFSVEVSNGIGNSPMTAAVPEPSVWALLLVGFGGLGFVAYHRSQKAQTAVAAA
jgi:hypothetical protein